MSEPNQPELDDGLIECWCGTKGTYEEMFCDCCDGGCGGTGYLTCECGGDGLCVCHHHGEHECFGCEDCEGADEDDYDWSDEEVGEEA